MYSRQRYVKSLTAGTVSFNTADEIRGTLKHISVNPSSTTTTYDIEMTDDLSTIVYVQKGKKGDFADDSKLGTYGLYTFTIRNASVSTNSFTVTLIWNDNI